jgi:hypothetical protein
LSAPHTVLTKHHSAAYRSTRNGTAVIHLAAGRLDLAIAHAK